MAGFAGAVFGGFGGGLFGGAGGTGGEGGEVEVDAAGFFVDGGNGDVDGLPEAVLGAAGGDGDVVVRGQGEALAAQGGVGEEAGLEGVDEFDEEAFGVQGDDGARPGAVFAAGQKGGVVADALDEEGFGLHVRGFFFGGGAVAGEFGDVGGGKGGREAVFEGGEEAVGDEVGVAADGGGEVEVAAEAESEVGGGGGGVDGALEVAEEGEGDDVAEGGVGDGAGDAVEVVGGGGGGAGDAQGAEFGGHAGPLVGFGLRVDAPGGGEGGGVEFLGYGAVGGEHAFFDEGVGLGGAALFEGEGGAGGVEGAVDFGEGEVEGAVEEAAASHGGRGGA